MNFILSTYATQTCKKADAERGHENIVRLCHEWGVSDVDDVMAIAAFRGYIDIVQQCRERGASDFDTAAEGGHINIVQL